jgi:hypothetical protein
MVITKWETRNIETESLVEFLRISEAADLAYDTNTSNITNIKMILF